MNNISQLCAIILICLTFAACNGNKRYAKYIDEADRLSDSIPYQALKKLEEIKNMKQLSEEQQHLRNFIYTKSITQTGNKLESDSITVALIRYYSQQNDSSKLHQSLFFNGFYHYQNMSYDSAVAYFDKAADAVPKENEVSTKSYYKRFAGASYLHLGNTQAAVTSQKEAVQIAYISNEYADVYRSLINLADAHKYNNDTDQSLEICRQALDLAKQNENIDNEAYVLNLMSNIYERNNQNEEALHCINEAQKMKRNRNDVPAINLYRAILFDKQNMPDSAQYYAQLSIKGNDLYVADLAYLFLSTAEEKQGRYATALNLSKAGEQVFNQFLTGLRSTDMQQKYEQQKLENENNQLKIKQREHQFYLIITLFMLVLMMIAIYITRANNKRKNEKTAHKNRMLQLEHDNMLLKQQQEISALRAKEALLRESLFKRINFFHKLPSLRGEENDTPDKKAKIRITAQDWQELTNSIKDAYPNFLTKLDQLAPTLSDDDIRFCCLIKINVNMQDLSDIYCVSKAAITKRKYRLKTEKFNIDDSTINLDTILQEIN